MLCYKQLLSTSYITRYKAESCYATNSCSLSAILRDTRLSHVMLQTAALYQLYYEIQGWAMLYYKQLLSIGYITRYTRLGHVILQTGALYQLYYEIQGCVMLYYKQLLSTSYITRYKAESCYTTNSCSLPAIFSYTLNAVTLYLLQLTSCCIPAATTAVRCLLYILHTHAVQFTDAAKYSHQYPPIICIVFI